MGWEKNIIMESLTRQVRGKRQIFIDDGNTIIQSYIFFILFSPWSKEVKWSTTVRHLSEKIRLFRLFSWDCDNRVSHFSMSFAHWCVGLTFNTESSENCDLSTVCAYVCVHGYSLELCFCVKCECKHRFPITENLPTALLVLYGILVNQILTLEDKFGVLIDESLYFSFLMIDMWLNIKYLEKLSNVNTKWLKGEPSSFSQISLFIKVS